MTEFDVYTKEVEIRGKKFVLSPLTGAHLPKLYAAAGRLSKAGDDMEQLDEQTIKNLHECIVAMFKQSGYDGEKLEPFVSQNLMSLANVLAALHFETKE